MSDFENLFQHDALKYHAAVLIGRITGLARPSVSHGLLSRKHRPVGKAKLV